MIAKLGHRNSTASLRDYFDGMNVATYPDGAVIVSMEEIDEIYDNVEDDIQSELDRVKDQIRDEDLDFINLTP
jgi:hypothetical protein